MRDIKFRAWEKSLKQIIPVDDINFQTKMINTEHAWRMFDEVELMQFTGLLDKNGKEIYEGDILFWPKGWMYENMTGEVKWNNGYYFINDKIKWHLKPDRPTDGHIIGNIYENPELLFDPTEGTQTGNTSPTGQPGDGWPD